MRCFSPISFGTLRRAIKTRKYEYGNTTTYFLALGIAGDDAAELGRQPADVQLLLLVAVAHHIVQPLQIGGGRFDFAIGGRLLVLPVFGFK